MEPTERKSVFERFKREQRSYLDDQIETVLIDMQRSSPSSEQYAKALTSLERLTRMKEDKKVKVSPDTVLVVLGNLLGIGIIVGFEKSHVIGSKALPFVFKPKQP
jgi:hypothetical protein